MMDVGKIKTSKTLSLLRWFFLICLETLKKILVAIFQGFKPLRHILFSETVRIDNIIKTKHFNQEVEQKRQSTAT
jgi:hypothetical protein